MLLIPSSAHTDTKVTLYDYKTTIVMGWNTGHLVKPHNNSNLLLRISGCLGETIYSYCIIVFQSVNLYNIVNNMPLETYKCAVCKSAKYE